MRNASPERGGTIRRGARYLLLAAIPSVVLLGVLDRLFPLPPLDTRFARVVVANDGTPLRAFADESGIWRYPVSPEQVSPNYIEALLSYEDRWFYSHPGFNPFSLMRATAQNIRFGRIISGGSTLTMQVARLVDSSERTIPGKLKQIFRALQLEWHCSKEEILTLYLNRAPFGGTVEGVQAAAFTYLGKSAAVLSDAEAALMAVLPQAPSRNRPDRHPHRARAMRDKVLSRLVQLGVWPADRAQDAMKEPVWAQFYKQPLAAPLLSRRLITEYPEVPLLRTTLDTDLQAGISDLVKNRIQLMPSGTSAAVLVMENRSLAVRAYVGSADFSDGQRFGYVDMVQALRSPGSTLKPFVYGMALEAGLVHSQSLLADAPSDFGEYRPENFDLGYSGPVSVTEALQRSLNVPAVQVLEKVGENRFMSRLKNAGMVLKLPDAARANLALGLGGVGTTLESLVGAYSSLANGGYAGRPRMLQSETPWQRRLLSEGAAWVVGEILRSHRRPDQPLPYLMSYGENGLAWKTGTSYGFRDSWAVGATADYTVGVWVGRPDATPLPGYYGAVTAAPILFAITDHLPAVDDGGGRPASHDSGMPESVAKAEICWPLGGLLSKTDDALCHRKKEAYLVDGQVPATFPDSDESWEANPVTFLVNAENGLRVDMNCGVPYTREMEVALWPKVVEPWVVPRYRRYGQIPGFDRRCGRPPAVAAGQIKIAGIHSDSVLNPVGATTSMPGVELRALGGQGKYSWFINGELLYRLNPMETRIYQFERAGRYLITVVDEQGGSDEVAVTVASRSF